jgi:signal transduction histidine kinase
LKQKILLVDDKEDNLFSLETVLEPGGYQFVKANSGKQALKILLKEVDFALILMDVNMPSLNGFETAALIYEREKLRNIPIIFITGNSYGEDNIFKGYKSGAVDYVFKPVNPDLLRAKVGVFTDLYEKNQRLRVQEQKLKAMNTMLQNEVKERRASEETVIELNRQLLENITRLETANKELDNFTFMASHDLQEPLRKIQTFSDLLHIKYKDVLDQDAVFHITRIQRSAKRMQVLIKDILDFSKLTTQSGDFAYSDLDVIMNEIIAELQSSVSDKKAKIEVQSLPSLVVNPRLIRTLFHNLISNALKYSKKSGAPVISIRAEYAPGTDGAGKKDFCRIYVKDNGVGFEQKYAEQVFDMFRRLHWGPEFEGTGIGLALCKKIVELHHGHISALSKVNEGSVFIVSLPVAQPKEASPEIILPRIEEKKNDQVREEESV